MKKVISLFLCFAVLFTMSIDCFAASQTGELRLGGGDSPSAAWTYKSSFTKTYTHEQLRKINNNLQGVLSSDRYTAGYYAYNTSIVLLGVSNVPVRIVTAAAITLFGQSYFSTIQASANAVARAYGAGGSQKLKVKIYERPASGEQMYMISN